MLYMINNLNFNGLLKKKIKLLVKRNDSLRKKRIVKNVKLNYSNNNKKLESREKPVKTGKTPSN